MIEKQIRLFEKELNRASNGYTIVVRSQKNGLYSVMAVNVETRKPIFNPTFITKSEIASAIKYELRMMDKCGFECEMASSSRMRYKNYA